MIRRFVVPILLLGFGLNPMPSSAADLELETCRDMAQQTYIAYYGRPADFPGLEYWAGRLCDASGWFDELIDAFGTSPEYQEVFGSLTNEGMIDAIYDQLFRRLPDPEGKAFYLDLLATGQTTLPRIALDVANGAQNNDLTILMLRNESADYFTYNARWSDFPYDLNTRDQVASILGTVVDEPTLAESKGEYRALFEGVYPMPPATTRVLDPWDAYEMNLEGELLSYVPVTPEASDPSIGDLVVTNPFFAEAGARTFSVQAVAEDGNRKVLTTVAVRFEDAVAGAVDDETIVGSIALGYDDLETATTPEGVTISPGDPLAVADREVAPIRIDFDTALMQEGVSGSAQGYVSLLPEIKYELGMTGGAPGDLSLGLRLRKDVRNVVDANGSAVVDWQLELLTMTFRQVSFRVGGVPVYLDPELAVTASIDGTLNGQARFGIQRIGSDSTYGVDVDAAGSAAIFEEAGVDPATSPDGVAVTSEYELSSNVSVQGHFGLYAAEGIDFQSIAEIGAQGNFGGSETCVDLEASRTDSVGISAEGLARLDADFDAVVLDEVDYTEQFCDIVGGSSLVGSVIDAGDNSPLPGVTVLITDGPGNEVARGFTDANGLFEFPVQSNVGLHANFQIPGYIGVYYFVGTVAEGDAFTMERVRLINSSMTGPGTIEGRIIDATNGFGINGANVTLRHGINVTGGEIVSQTECDTNGDYQLTGIEAGNYTLQGSTSGFLDGFATGLVLGGSTSTADVTITPELAAGEWRIVLTWGQIPEDLDSHLTGPGSDGQRFHVFWADPRSEFADLDVDDVTSYGPETITIRQQLDGVYRYSVHDYTNSLSSSSTGLGNSGARVEVYKGPDRVGIYNVPNTDGTLWTVFEIQGNQIFSINRMSYEDESSDVEFLPAPDIPGGLRGTDADRIRNLPSK